MRTFFLSFLLFLALAAISNAETKFLVFATKAEAVAKELELRNTTNCANPATKTNKYCEIVAAKDGTFLVPVEPVFNHTSKQTVNVENTVLLPAEKAALLTKNNSVVKAAIEYDTTEKPK
jgi:hypothetical protein